MTLIEKVAVFFSAGTRKHKLQDILQEQGSDDGPRGIPLMSDTRWGSRIKTVSAFISKLEPTVHCKKLKVIAPITLKKPAGCATQLNPLTRSSHQL